jgi:DNA primase
VFLSSISPRILWGRVFFFGKVFLIAMEFENVTGRAIHATTLASFNSWPATYPASEEKWAADRLRELFLNYLQTTRPMTLTARFGKRAGE